MFFRATLLIALSALALNFVKCEIYRLPKDVKPLRYFLTMEPHLRDSDLWGPMPYEGSVTIELDVLKNTRNITLHQNGIEIDNSSIVVVSSSGKKIEPSVTSSDDEEQTYTIQMESELLKDEKYNLTIGSFNRSLGRGEGFFMAVYWANDQARSLAVTHFEPTGARRAFPCFDEPAIKAHFIISLIRKQGYNSVSNEELDFTEDLGDGRFKDTFKETPVMSSFNVAFAVSDLKATATVDRQRIFGTPELIEQGKADQALQIGVQTLQALEEYTAMNFTLKKLDQFAVPQGFFFESAMENWGLVVYDGPQLLHGNESSAEEYKRCVFLMAHEFAHQWFGNLVTPEWWDYLWLSESFSAYFQYYISGVVRPTWRMMEQFVIDMVQVALNKEEEQGAYPLNYPVEYSGQYPPFHIMYEKGASIIRMMEHFITHDVFRTALQKYLKENQFGVTLPSDLFKSIQEAVDEAGVQDLLNKVPIADILNNWTNNKGFPIITVTRDYTTGDIKLEQNSKFDNSSSPWLVPINFAFSSGNRLDFSKTTADYWLSETSASINDHFPTEGWVIVNKQQTGYYRVNYDRENWERIIGFLKSENFTLIHPVNRAQIIDDIFYFAAKEQLPWDVPLRLGEYLVRERDYIPLSAFYNALREYIFVYQYNYYSEIDKELRYFKNYTLSNEVYAANPNATEYDVYKEYIATVLSGVHEDLGFEPKPTDTHLDKLNRNKFNRFRYYFEK